jgi:hypothetical protein
VKLTPLAPLALVSLAGCSVLVQPNLDRLRDGGSTGPDAQVTPDGSVVTPDQDVVAPPADVSVSPDATTCANDCDDRIACTIDRCNSGRCTNTPDNTACGPDMRCDPTAGCVPAMMPRCARPTDCNDNNPCTVEACNSGTCANTPVDRDGDGSPAAMVDGAMCAFPNADCDDNNRAVNPSAMEICDRIDNNCNRMIDEIPGCMVMPPPNTTCATAARLDLTSATSAEVTGDNSRAMSTVSGYCGRGDLGTGGELWYQVTWPAGRDLVLEASRTADVGDPVLFVAQGCGQMPIVCNDDISARDNGSRVYIRSESLTGIGTRTVFVAVDAFNAAGGGAMRLRARTQMPVGSDCGSAFVIEGGGAVRSSPGAGSLRMPSCGGAVGNVEHYRYRGTAGSVRANTSSGTLAVRRDCTSMMPFCPGANAMFMSGGDTIIAAERPMGAYVLSVYGP